MNADSFQQTIDGTKAVCPIGETYGNKCREEGKIPVISCEGSCIRGEIARRAANMLAKHEPYRRGCHGEIFTAPHSAIADWAQKSDKVIVIDGCFMRCHGRILKGIVGSDRMIQFDALAIHKKYTDLMDIDDVPEKECKATAEHVADTILNILQNGACAAVTAGRTSCCTQQ